MGNLSCVSCKVKDKCSQKSIADLSLSDYKGASFNKEVVAVNNTESQTVSNQDSVRFVENIDVRLPSYGRTNAQELYEILKSQRLKKRRPTPAHDLFHVKELSLHRPCIQTTIEEDDSNLDDVQKAAKAIVDMTVFLTTQVIYPAYLTYLREDHPDVYTQYFERPETPLPGDSVISVGDKER